jgi:hypothetical protein
MVAAPLKAASTHKERVQPNSKCFDIDSAFVFRPSNTDRLSCEQPSLLAQNVAHSRSVSLIFAVSMGIDPLRQERPRFITQRACFTQTDLRIGAQGEALLRAEPVVAQIPRLPAPPAFFGLNWPQKRWLSVDVRGFGWNEKRSRSSSFQRPTDANGSL